MTSLIQHYMDEHPDKALEYFCDATNELSFALIKYRKAHSLTQAELAKKLEVSRAMVSKLESCDYNYTLELLSSVCAKLNWKFKIEILPAR